MRGAAFTTLSRGTRFLERLATRSSLAEPWPDGERRRLRAVFIGNCLRELDLFLLTLMNDVEQAVQLTPLPARRNSANRLGRIAAGRWDSIDDQIRLRALGRSRACLSYCRGTVRRADVPNGMWLTAGWSDHRSGDLQRYRMGDYLTPSGADLKDVGVYYRLLAERMVGIGADRTISPLSG